MHESLLSIKINTSVENLFDFTINPDNTHKWIEWIKKEWVEWEKIQIWSIYKCESWNGNISASEVVNLIPNSLFHIKSLDSHFEVIYFYTRIDNNQSILNYYQFMSDKTPLSKSLWQEHLEVLKNILEGK